MADSFEKQIKLKPIPDNLYKILKKPQISTLLHAEAMGWSLWFAGAKFTVVVPVIETNGRMKRLSLRKMAISTPPMA